AGPGSGKTMVITHRIANLVRVWRISPRRILAVTFTNKAANEMRDRLQRLVGRLVDDLTLGTFHAICARILRQEGQAIGLAKDFVIYDDDDKMNLVKVVLEEMSLDTQKYPPRGMLSEIEAAKSQLLNTQAYRAQVTGYHGEVVARVYERYQQMLHQNIALDFNDLLMKAVILFREHDKVLARYQERYLHVLVDEFQDTNMAQYVLVKQLAGKHRNICVVGDPDQSIYGWRFADVRNILNFEKDFPDARVVLLEQNYRSTRTILEVASGIISGNRQRKPKKLWTENEEGSPVAVVETFSEREEAQFVAGEVERLVRQGGAAWGDCAVMYRTNAQSRALEETFFRYGLPYRLVGGTRFYQRREIKDIVAYLRLVHNPSDGISLMRVLNVPGRGLGERSISELMGLARAEGSSLFAALEKVARGGDGQSQETSQPRFNGRSLRAFAGFATLITSLLEKKRQMGLVELLDQVIEGTGYREYILKGEDGEERWENVQELRTAAREYRDFPAGEGLAAFLEKVSLVADVDELDEKVEASTFITLHQAKGLEFPVVFMVGMEEEVLPHYRSMADPAEMEEERRLCYVGVTRAEKQLYLVRAHRRSLFGRSAANPPSRFLEDIPPHLVKREGVGVKVSEGGPAKPGDVDFSAYDRDEAPSPKSSVRLEVGDKVCHAKFGSGTVVGSNGGKGDQEVTVLFDSIGTKKLLLGYAPLEKV
ncbi:MAG: uvrD, partial [Dehalococcoidia bacterium]|nr:uvrD [Dehalococcoidia bacterium]